eukprot:1195717-Prorocentrum_minimum.AAC.6
MMRCTRYSYPNPRILSVPTPPPSINTNHASLIRRLSRRHIAKPCSHAPSGSPKDARAKRNECAHLLAISLHLLGQRNQTGQGC